MSRRTVLLLVLVADVAMIGGALAVGWDRPLRYFGEHGVITKFSLLQLFACSVLAWATYETRRDPAELNPWKAPQFVWALIALGFFYLVFDEMIQIHESIDFFLHWLFRAKQTVLTDRLDDIIVGGYGVCGLIILYYYRGELKKFKETIPLLVVGFVLLFIMVVLDALGNRKDVVQAFISDPKLANWIHHLLEAGEDSFKVLAEGVFIGAFYCCLDIARRLRAGPAPAK